MIKFSLKCAQDHRFDSWFQSSDAFDKLAARGLVSCSMCGDTDVEKTVMAPSVRSARAQPADAQPPSRPHALAAPSTPAEQAMADLRRRIEANSEYVGTDFVQQARLMHDGDAPTRSIHGEAKPNEARQLIEEGVPILPLPFRPVRKVN
jgi:hypothetical protein